MSFPEVGLGAAAREWFEANFAAPTPVQTAGWARIAEGEHALLIAPTGSGKTLAAFLYSIDRLSRRSPPAEPGVRVLYVSPLKALVYDIERNLRLPLAGIQKVAEARGEAFRAPRVAIRTGDTTPRERRGQLRDPAEILVTTPESLYLLLTSKARDTLRTVETVIVDEIHALAPSKRGAHLALSLERLSRRTRGGEPTRIGLSATARPLEEVARFLGGDRPVSIVDTSVRPNLDLTISVPVPDMTRPDLLPLPPVGVEAASEGDAALDASLEGEPKPPVTSLWPALYPKILEAIRAHRSSIVFVNSRGLCEKLAQELNEGAGEELVRAHHGSIAHDARIEIEESLKSGALRAIVATSSLELGIDMGAVDLVLLVESPGAVSRGLQRVGRAGHQVGETSRALFFPKHRGDLLEAVVVAEGMREGAVESIAIPRSPLDVLAQQIVAMTSQETWELETLFGVVRRSANFRDLPRSVFIAVLEMLAGRYPSTDFAELRPRIVWDRDANTLEGRGGAARLAILSGGTIPDRGQYAVHLGEGGPRIGELDEEMVHETRPGDPITLGASTWRVVEITRDRVFVVPAPGEVGRLPFWRGDGPGRPLELGRRLGAFCEELSREIGIDSATGERPERSAGERWLVEEHGLDAWAARNLVDYVVAQVEATGSVPTDRAITIERFRDELGDWRVCLLSPFGARLHKPWALAIESKLSEEAGYEVEALASDDGIVLRFADADRTPPLESLLPDPDEVEERVVAQLAGSALFAAQFRENAARALLLPRRRPGARTPLWVQRLRSQNLLAVAMGFPSFPIMLETYRSCLQDVFDMAGLREVLSALRQRTIRVDSVETPTASPFARSLVFAYTATYLYQLDMPAAERRAQALTLDRNMLRELLGEENLRALLDAEVIAAVESSLQGQTEAGRARHPDGLHDLLRRIGDLREDEIAERSAEAGYEAWLDELERRKRVVKMQIGGEARWVVAEDAALYRDALGSSPPEDLALALLEVVENPFAQLILRWARSHGPFSTRRLAERFALLPNQLEPVLARLESEGRLLSGDFHPLGSEREWCEPEVLRRIRRQTLSKLREEVAPVEGPVLARFLFDWQGVLRPGRGAFRLEEVLDQLEGFPVSFAALETWILPARIARYDPRMLDELGALGEWIWIGRGALGDRDGRVALYRRESVALLVEETPLPEEARPLHRELLALLDARGASFFSDLVKAAGEAEPSEVFAALWDLVWWGQVTNDTFAPLRALVARPAARPSASVSAKSAARRPGRPRRQGANAPPNAAAGRWSRTRELLDPSVAPTRRAHERTLRLLERHGVLSREAMALEELSLGWSGVYPVLRAMEEAGRVRRGYFAEGLSGAQFALESVVDRLRGARRISGPMQARVLSATDPANPYGASLPWPESRSESAPPRRSALSTVVFVDGEPLLFVDRAGKKIWSFLLGDPDREEAAMLHAARALGSAADRFPRGGLRIEMIDGARATAPEVRGLFEAFIRAGFRRSYRGIEFDRSSGGDLEGGDTPVEDFEAAGDPKRGPERRP